MLVHNLYLEYCKAFDVNFRPIICILKNGTQTAPPNYHQHPPPPPPPPQHPTQYPILQPSFTPDTDSDSDDDDDECSCEVTCIPRIVNQRAIQKNYYHQIILKRFKRTSTTSYRCRSCGTECPVSTLRQPTCNCVIPATKSECSCTATCASFRFNPFYFQSFNDETDDANCILSVNALEDWRLGEERPPYVCDCKRSKEAENTSRPDFICVCQRVSRDF